MAFRIPAMLLVLGAGRVAAQASSAVRAEPDDRTMAVAPYGGLEADLGAAQGGLGAVVLGLEYVWRRKSLIVTPIDLSVIVPGEGAYVRLAVGGAYHYRPRGLIGVQLGASRFDPARLMIAGRITSGEITLPFEVEARITHQKIDHPSTALLMLLRFASWF